MRLNAARSFANRVPFSVIMRQKIDTSDQDEIDALSEDVEFWTSHIGSADAARLSAGQLASNARTLRDLECLVKALDTMETIASLAELSKEYDFLPTYCLASLTIPRDPSVKRDFWAKVSNEVKSAKDHVQPLLKNWLLGQGKLTKPNFLAGHVSLFGFQTTQTWSFYGTCICLRLFLPTLAHCTLLAQP